MKIINIKKTLSYVTLPIFAHSAYSDELNTHFLHGVSELPAVFNSDIRYPSGSYFVDVILNGRKVRTDAPLVISPLEETSGKLCLNHEWLTKSGIYFKPDEYQNTYNEKKSCYTLEEKDGTKIYFDLANQLLDISIPQAWIANKKDTALWDYGVNGFRLGYTGNFNKNIQSENNPWRDDSINAYGSVNANLNLGRWILSSDMNVSKSKYVNSFDTNNITLSTAISQIQGDLLIGRSQTRTELFQDFGFYGVALRSNRNMRQSISRGYAPVISGVASSTSRITISQNGYTIYSRVVPPGPYQLDDISAVSNGNIIVTVEDSSGYKTQTEYPIATLPSLLRPGEYNYNWALGERTDSHKVEDAFRSDIGVFALASFDYGLSSTTFNSAFLLHGKYQAAGIGITKPLGKFGVFSSNLNTSKASYDNGDVRRGMSASFKYAKSFNTRTDLQLLTYRYQSSGYTEFSNWRPDEYRYRSGYYFDEKTKEYRYLTFSNKEKARYEARLSHRFDNFYLSGSYWQQSYWDQKTDSVGASLSASTSINDISLYFSGNYARSGWSKMDDYSGSISISIPFSIGKTRHYSSSSVGYNQYKDITFNTSAYATVSDRFNYNVSASVDNRNERSIGVSGSYAFDSVQTNVSLNKNKKFTTLSGSLSGTAIATAETGVFLTKENSKTIAIVKIKDTPGITFNGSLPTSNRGNTALYLTEYNPVSININPENVPNNSELLHTSFDIVPTEKAIIYREFEYRNVLRYILRLRDNSGNVIAGGNATTEQGLNAGFISNNGVLLMNLLAAPKVIYITQANGKSCNFNADSLKENTGKIQEVRCE